MKSASFLQRATYRILARESRRGQDVPPHQLLSTLLTELPTIVGEMHKQPVKLQSQIPTRLFAAKPNKGNALKKYLDEMDFSVTYMTTSGALGATRVEINRGTTVVNYSNHNGVLTVTSTLPFAD